MTLSPPRDPTTFQILGPSGLNLNVDQTVGGPVLTASRPIPGGFWQPRGLGVQAIPPGILSGRQGTVKVAGYTHLFTPASSKGIFTLGDADPPNTKGNVIAFRETMGFTIAATIYAAGVAIASGSIGPYPQSTVWSFDLRIVWDTTTKLDGESYALFFVDGKLVPWSLAPTATWEPWVPTFLNIGYGLGVEDPWDGTVSEVHLANTVDIPG